LKDSQEQVADLRKRLMEVDLIEYIICIDHVPWSCL